MPTYKEVYKDHQTLWSIGEASDMTGGYVDQEDLDRLLENPTKATAKRCLLDQMEYWLQNGIENPRSNSGISPHELVKDHPEIRKIAKKYGFDF